MTSHRAGCKIWIENKTTRRSIEWGPIYHHSDLDTWWVRVDGVLILLRTGQRVEITSESVEIKECVRPQLEEHPYVHV